jgi:hypothetical protein
MRVLQNRVLRKIFGPKRDEVTGEWRSSMIRAPYQYYLGDQIKKNEMGGACDTYGRQERCIKGFRGETRGKETTWKTRHRWKAENGY